MDNCPDHEIRGSLWPFDPAALVSNTHLTFRTLTQTRRRHVREEEEHRDIAETVTPLCKSQGFRGATSVQQLLPHQVFECVWNTEGSHSHKIKSHTTPIRRQDPLIWARQPAPFSWLDANGGWACKLAPCWARSLWIIVSLDSLLIDSKATREPFSWTLFYLTWFYFPSVTSCLSP